ncbi:MAG: hypothetical protein KDK25_09825, partial [Leptospiraceae bacterium]|nr:hypothetical protein [Leptospiraceae bacterium]
MAVTKKGLGWELLQSWHILLTLVPMGFTGWIAFAYQGLRAGKFKWLIAAVFYLAAVVGMFYLTDAYPDGEARPDN